jgi:hypothetical protein
MNEADQILEFLSHESFWEDRCPDWAMVGGMSLGITKKGNRWEWAFAFPSGKPHPLRAMGQPLPRGGVPY